MRLKALLLPVITGMIVAGCAPAGPLSPRESFDHLAAAVKNNDTVLLWELIDTRSREKIASLAAGLRKLPEKSAVRVARYYGTTPEALMSLTAVQFLSLFLRWDQNVVHQVVQQPVVSIDEMKTTARVTVANGMYLDFVREGPYWRFDLTGL